MEILLKCKISYPNVAFISYTIKFKHLVKKHGKHEVFKNKLKVFSR